jgi:Cu(I)/Ag(I) efflux system membrane fusion protein
MHTFPFSLRLLRWLLAVAFLSVALRGADQPTSYQCSMHPWIKSNRPGKCTICGMDLVLATAASDLPAGTVSLAASSVSTIGVQTATVSRQSLTRTLRVAGRIEDDDTRHRILSARVPGRIEKLFITFVGAPIEAGAPLATLWSPEVLTAQRVYVERLKAGSIAFSASEQSAAREQLQQLGMEEADIIELEQKRIPSALVTVRAPVAGVVVAKTVYTGQYVQPSDRLFEIADFSQMWFVFDAYAQDIPWIRVGQTVELTTRAVPGEVISAPIEFIDPNFDEERQTTRVRAVLPNPHYTSGGESHFLPHRVIAEGRVLVETPAVLAAPRSAVLDTGSGAVAYVATNDHVFEQRKLKLGRKGDALVEVLSGLAEGEQVVTQGNLLIDAQAQLSHEASSGAAHATHNNPAAGDDHGANTAMTSTPGLTAQSPTNSREKTPEARLGNLAALAIDAADALASDDYVRYQKLFPQLKTLSPEFSLPLLELGDSLKSARRSFETWSTKVANLLAPHRSTLGLKIFECPMAPVLGKGRWVQRTTPIRNPFFGSAMPDCGEEVR